MLVGQQTDEKGQLNAALEQCVMRIEKEERRLSHTLGRRFVRSREYFPVRLPDDHSNSPATLSASH